MGTEDGEKHTHANSNVGNRKRKDSSEDRVESDKIRREAGESEGGMLLHECSRIRVREDDEHL